MKQCQRQQWPNRGLLWGLLVCLWAQLGCSAMRLGSRPDIELEDPAALGKTVVTNPLALPVSTRTASRSMSSTPTSSYAQSAAV
jgi:hypothetical protein